MAYFQGFSPSKTASRTGRTELPDIRNNLPSFNIKHAINTENALFLHHFYLSTTPLLHQFYDIFDRKSIKLSLKSGTIFSMSYDDLSSVT